MKKRYSYNYNHYDATVSFEIDTEVFTEEIAKATLEFFTWDYDKENNPIDEVLKKYALQAIRVSTFNDFNEHGVISEFENMEGYCRLDGSNGIMLVEVTGYEFDENSLFLEDEV